MTATFNRSAIGSTVAQAVYGPLQRDDLRRYAEASGDLNPLHLDGTFARQAGFGDVIVHGMLGMALLGRLVSESYPAHRLLRFSCRFRGVINVGQPIACGARLEALEGETAVLALRAQSAEGAVLLEGSATLGVPLRT
jgi:acyl dehydratase